MSNKINSHFGYFRMLKKLSYASSIWQIFAIHRKKFIMNYSAGESIVQLILLLSYQERVSEY